MRPLYILSHGNVRRDRATPDQIRAFVDGANSEYEQLARVALGEDGVVIATPLSAGEIAAIGLELQADQAVRLAALLVDTLKLARAAAECSGVSLLLAGLQIRIADAPHAKRLVLDFAAEHNLEVERKSPPRDRKSWAPELKVCFGWRTLVELNWPVVPVNTDEVIDEEVAAVSAERELAEQEMGAF